MCGCRRSCGAESDTNAPGGAESPHRQKGCWRRRSAASRAASRGRRHRAEPTASASHAGAVPPQVGAPGAPHSQELPTLWQTSPFGHTPPHSGVSASVHCGRVGITHAHDPLPLSWQTSLVPLQRPPQTGLVASSQSGSGGAVHTQLPEPPSPQDPPPSHTPAQTGVVASSQGGSGSSVVVVVAPAEQLSPDGNS